MVFGEAKELSSELLAIFHLFCSEKHSALSNLNWASRSFVDLLELICVQLHLKGKKAKIRTSLRFLAQCWCPNIVYYYQSFTNRCSTREKATPIDCVSWNAFIWTFKSCPGKLLYLIKILKTALKLKNAIITDLYYTVALVQITVNADRNGISLFLDKMIQKQKASFGMNLMHKSSPGIKRSHKNRCDKSKGAINDKNIMNYNKTEKLTVKL